MRNAPRIRRGHGRVTAGVWQQTLDAAASYAGRSEQLHELADGLTRYTQPTLWVLAKITGSALISGQTNRWEYTWEEVELTASGVQTRSGGLTSSNTTKAINLCEMVNNGTGVEGPGWSLTTAPTGFEIKPISEACVQLWSVRDTTAAFRWFFTLANVLDGECP
jgi:hypothetical protein